MKLRNKRTGEIGLVHCDATMFSDKIGVFIDNNHIDLRNPYKIYTSLAELNEEWEDYEEPKEYWYVYADKPQRADCGDILEEDFKAIGNYFETKEEAEKAVEKLKVWKRLKDKGFEFINFPYKKICKYDARTGVGNLEYQVKYYEELDDDLDLLFGGEE